MYYQTTIKSVGAGYAVDVQGKTLKFIGNLPCEAGDTVWTDGRVIFGNIAKRNDTPLDEPPSGIPVVADVFLGHSGTTCGYVKASGQFKSKRIAEGDWITNNKRTYVYGESSFRGKRIIDAEIIDDGGAFIVTDGFYRKCQHVSYNNHLYNIVTRYATEKNPSGEITFTSNHRFVYEVTPIVGQEVTLGADADDINTPATIYALQKDGEASVEIPLASYAQIAEQECWQCESELQVQSADITEAVNFIQQPAPPSNSFIALSYARVEAFKINPVGDWDAIISAAAYGYCFLYIPLDGSLFYRLFNGDGASLRNFSKSLALGLDMLETAIFGENHYPFLNIEKYPAFTGTEKDSDGNYTQEFQQYTVAKLEYYIPLVRFTHYKWEPFIFSANLLLHVHNGEIVTTIVKASGGGNEFEVTESWNEAALYGSYNTPSSTISTPDRPYADRNDNYTIHQENSWEFPIGDDYFLYGEGYDMSGVKKDDTTVFNFRGFNIPAGDIAEPSYPMPLLTQYDTVATSTGTDLSYFNHVFIPVYTYADNEELIDYIQDDDKAIYYPMWAHVHQDSDDGFFRFNFSAAPLRNGTLFGVYGDRLFKSTEIIGKGLKNFRLREMKNINKAKKGNSN